MDFLINLVDHADFGLLALRLAVGAIFIVHGLPKMKNIELTAKGIGMPIPMARLVAFIEVIGGVCMVLGLLVQIAAVGLGAIMVGAIYKKHVEWKVPFSYPDGKAGWEFDLMILAGCLTLFFIGGGYLSLDAFWLYI